MDVRVFHMEHLRQMRLQPQQRPQLERLTPETLEFMEKLEGYTAFVGDTPIACAGLMDIWPGRAMAWSYLAESAGPHLIAVTRAVRTFLDLKAPRRTELYVDAGFEPGYRWAELLGFKREGYLEAFESDGRDQVLYARIRHV